MSKTQIRATDKAPWIVRTLFSEWQDIRTEPVREYYEQQREEFETREVLEFTPTAVSSYITSLCERNGDDYETVVERLSEFNQTFGL